MIDKQFLLALLRDSRHHFLESFAEMTEEEARLRPAPDRFSLVEHACHLRDLEREGYLVRVRRMIAEKAPALEGFDGQAVARERGYLSQDARIAAQEFAAARREVTSLLAPLTSADLAREATFDGRRITFGELVAMMVEHDREHREEIEELMDAIERR
ncbi:MAG TPA: DinB family protein [Usitatibacter sp.]|nr:DinB family protein [Usitatibacter sp.]